MPDPHLEERPKCSEFLMRNYDWLRIARLLRIYRPDCWDEEDINRPLWERYSPYQIEPDGIYLPELALRDAPAGLTISEIAALYRGRGGKVLGLPATLPELVTFLETSGEYARLPSRMWTRLERLASGVEFAPTSSAAVLPVSEPDWLIFKDLAHAFMGLHGWDENGWLKNLRSNDAPWIKNAIQKAGKQGRAKHSLVNPLILARNLLQKELANGNDASELAHELDARFKRPPLVEWWDWWRRERSG
jgi:hypothetical protein